MITIWTDFVILHDLIRSHEIINTLQILEIFIFKWPFVLMKLQKIWEYALGKNRKVLKDYLLNVSLTVVTMRVLFVPSTSNNTAIKGLILPMYVSFVVFLRPRGNLTTERKVTCFISIFTNFMLPRTIRKLEYLALEPP